MAKARKGRLRLTLLLCGLSGSLCTLMMAVILVFYGRPYDLTWWWIMGGILIASFTLPRLLVIAIEWVMEGYRQPPSD